MPSVDRREFLIASAVGLTSTVAGCGSNGFEEGTILLENTQRTSHTVRIEVRGTEDWESDIEPIETELAAGEVREFTGYIDTPGMYRAVGFLDGERAGTAHVSILTNSGNGQYLTATVVGAENLRVQAHDIEGLLSGFWDRV